jgi:hypothetical protein
MKGRMIGLVVAAVLALVLAGQGCKCSPGEPPPPPRVPSAQVEIYVEGGVEVVGPFLSDDFCPDGKTPCAEVMNADQTRAWCGCPEEPEPSLCHVVKTRGPTGWAASCSGGCPVPEGLMNIDRCDEIYESLEPLPGIDRRQVLSCECVGHDY